MSGDYCPGVLTTDGFGDAIYEHCRCTDRIRALEAEVAALKRDLEASDRERWQNASTAKRLTEEKERREAEAEALRGPMKAAIQALRMGNKSKGQVAVALEAALARKGADR